MIHHLPPVADQRMVGPHNYGCLTISWKCEFRMEPTPNIFLRKQAWQVFNRNRGLTHRNAKWCFFCLIVYVHVLGDRPHANGADFMGILFI